MRYRSGTLWLILLGALILFMLFAIKNDIECHAEEDHPELRSCHMTAYCYTGSKGADGTYPRIGTCAYMSQYIGYVAVVYEDLGNGKVGEYVGTYEITDTGYGHDSMIKDSDGKTKGTIEIGRTIDIYRNTVADCYDFIGNHGDSVLVQLIKGEG